MKRTMYLLALALLLAPLSMVGCGSDSGTPPTADAGGTGGHLDGGGGTAGNDGGTSSDTGAVDVAQDAPAPLDTQAVDGPKVDTGTHVDSTSVDTTIAVDVGAPLDVAAPVDASTADHPAVIDSAAID